MLRHCLPYCCCYHGDCSAKYNIILFDKCLRSVACVTRFGKGAAIGDAASLDCRRSCGRELSAVHACSASAARVSAVKQGIRCSSDDPPLPLLSSRLSAADLGCPVTGPSVGCAALSPVQANSRPRLGHSGARDGECGEGTARDLAMQSSLQKTSRVHPFQIGSACCHICHPWRQLNPYYCRFCAGSVRESMRRWTESSSSVPACSQPPMTRAARRNLACLHLSCRSLRACQSSSSKCVLWAHFARSR